VLAAARVLVGLTQRELASAAGLAASSVARFEAGRSTLRADSLGAILAVLKARGIRFVEETDEIAEGVVRVKRS
jgi:transcriptional regulator with XRE-family HTH domain